MIRRWLFFIVAVFLLHFAWEMAQGNLFVGMREQSLLDSSVRCLKATLGDIVITAIAFAIAGIWVGKSEWPLTSSTLAVALFLGSGLLITVGFERFALATNRWAYTSVMPTVSGIGLSPIAQWIVIPVLELPLFRLIWRRAKASKLNRTRQ